MRADQRVFSIRQWPGMRSEYCWLPASGAVTVTRPHQIGVSFSEHDRVAYEVDGRGRYLRVPGGAVFATGPQAVYWSEVRQPAEALEIYPEVEFEIEPVAAGRDATVLGVAAVLRRAHLGRLDLDDMQASTLAHRLLTHLADDYRRPGRRPTADRRPRPGRLDRALLDRVARLVDERLAEPLRLDDLAREARLSPYHFARAFKSSTGLAPHEFVTMRRLERAKAMLLTTRRGVAEVAAAVGYVNVGHFRRLLRRHTGFTPADLRPQPVRSITAQEPQDWTRLAAGSVPTSSS